MFSLEKIRHKMRKNRSCVFKYLKAVRWVVDVLYGPKVLHKSYRA